MKLKQLAGISILSLSSVVAAAEREYDVAAYVWPSYQNDPRWQKDLGIFKKGIGEWQNVQEARSKWPGHLQPRVPLYGYGNEADPAVIAKRIDLAVAHGINVFLYDWYWYAGKPFLEDGLDKGFLGAPNNGKMKFMLMWANHHFNDICNNQVANKGARGVLLSGFVDEAEFHRLVPRWIDKYFRRPNYYRIDGKPVFMIYETHTFIRGLGGEEAARRALDYLREECRKAGLGGLHLMACDCGLSKKRVEALGIESATMYNFCHWASPSGFPDFATWSAKGATRFDAAKELGLKTYFPHASVGWDTNPRWPATHPMPTVLHSTPDKFEVSLRRAKDWSDRNHPQGMPKLITINAWNEWIEGSYLEPDRLWGKGYLEAVRRVFGPAPKAPSVNVLKHNPYVAAELVGSEWLWHPEAMLKAGRVRFRTTVELPAAVVGGAFTMTADNGLTLAINGKRIAEKGHADCDWMDLLRIGDLNAASWTVGRNIIEVEALNTAEGEAGFIGAFRLQLANGTWLSIPTGARAWEASLDGQTWIPAKVVGSYGCRPWGTLE